MFGPVMIGNPVLSVVQICVVGDKHTRPRIMLLYHRMASVLDADDALFVDLRLHIIVTRGHRGQGCEHINAPQ